MKLAFWRKDEPKMPEDFAKGLDLGAADELGLPGAGGMPDMPEMPGAAETGAEAPQAFPRLEESRPQQPMMQQQAYPQQQYSGKDLEIISLKLDSLKTTLEAINERLARLEKAAEGDRESPRF